MKKLTALVALGLTLGIFAGCGKEPPVSTTAPTPPTTLPVETTLPPETTVPPTTEPPAPEVIGFDLTPPEGFTAAVMQDSISVYISPNAPMDSSTITVERLPLDESALTISQSALEALLLGLEEQTQPMTEEATEETAEETTEAPTEAPTEETTDPNAAQSIRIHSMEQIEADGWPALLCDYTVAYPTYALHSLRCEVVANDRNYVFTFTDHTDNNFWLSDFREAVDSIDMILSTEGMELDYSHLTRYDLPCGLRMYAEQGLEPHEAPGFTDCIGNRNVIVLLMADDKVENNLLHLDLKEYAAMIAENNDLEDFRKDLYGNLHTSFYSTDETGRSYFNMLFLLDTDQDYWVCQFACSADDQAAYAREFSLWASSISA